MHRVLAGLAIAAVWSATWSGTANGAAGTQLADRVLIRTVAGRSVDRATIQEPAGVIRLLRVTAPAGSRVTVRLAIPGLAGVSASLPRARFDNAETCSRSHGHISCTKAVEACPLPAASWHIVVRKASGPAGLVRIYFVIGSPSAR